MVTRQLFDYFAELGLLEHFVRWLLWLFWSAAKDVQLSGWGFAASDGVELFVC